MQAGLARIGTALQHPARIRVRPFKSLLHLALVAAIASAPDANSQQAPPPVFAPAPPVLAAPAQAPIIEPAPPVPLPAPVNSTPTTAPVFAPTPAVPPAATFPPPAPAAAAPVFAIPAFPATSAQPAVSPQASMKLAFANTLAIAAQATGATLVTGIVGAITGGLTEWFANRRNAAPSAAATVEPTNVPSAMPSALPVAVPAQTTAVAPPPVFSPLPAAGSPPPLPTVGPQFFDPGTGTSVAPDPLFTAPAGTGSADDALFAGLAYEVHAVTGGGTTPINPAFHEFHTGDRFVVFYRPTLPGHMEVFNINPGGMQTQIDSAQLAGGQLAQLGPYEFSGTKGDDRLRLMLTPCSTPELVLATRDIVKVPASAATAVAAPAAGALPACGLATRSGKEPVTRDIRKVALEGTTAFALDPVSMQERASGRLDIREVTIVFRHR